MVVGLEPNADLLSRHGSFTLIPLVSGPFCPVPEVGRVASSGQSHPTAKPENEELSNAEGSCAPLDAVPESPRPYPIYSGSGRRPARRPAGRNLFIMPYAGERSQSGGHSPAYVTPEA
ncbi:hypothetical protein Afil01_16280 [Actinorhabdospora filicis]|uniref:Uncharacterized protein n=1 Tax=Actinorhabdospora filicis TaxID=1785913 RepID=A0A9W6W8U1_9ACTN|nr:hypothetical protein Afil01_16280 [Actinorhabdospora filicis]